MRLLPWTVACFAVLLPCAVRPQPAFADGQWYVTGYLGGNRTQSATVTVRQPALDTAVAFHDVRFAAKPLQDPNYYGWRIGYEPAGRFGLEFEFVHLKVIGETGRTYRISGRFAGANADDLVAPMNELVQRYSMTHGLNFLLVNLVAKLPVFRPSGRTSMTARIGAGPTIPHAETTVGGRSRAEYEYGGLGVHAAVGLTVRVFHRVAALVEYKLTYARPEIDLVDGTGTTTAVSHHLAGGVVLPLWR
jgi:hypothetical protein